MTGLLFNIAEQQATPDISGLSYVPNFISTDEERGLLHNIDAQNWLADLKRRVQHYGYKYDYKVRAVTNDAYLGGLPDWLNPVAEKLCLGGYFNDKPDQAIVNEYEPGQGISAHIDCVPCFDDVIASLSLGSAAVMQFSNPKTGQKEELYLAPRSMVILSGAARYEWTHAIPARKSDIVQGFKISRERRVSVTFRSVIQSY